MLRRTDVKALSLLYWFAKEVMYLICTLGTMGLKSLLLVIHEKVYRADPTGPQCYSDVNIIMRKFFFLVSHVFPRSYL